MAQLSRQPICQACKLEGIITPAKAVDHVFPWRQIGDQAFWQNIWQSLCVEHHSHKTSLEQQGIFRHYREGGAKDYDRAAYVVALHDEYGVGVA